MNDRLGITRGFSISFLPTGRTQAHGTPLTGSIEDAVEEWIDAHPDHERREFAQHWLEQRLIEAEAERRIQGIRARRAEVMEQWERLTKRSPKLPEFDAAVRAMILKHHGVALEDEPD